MKQMLYKMAMLSQFLRDPWNFDIFDDRLGPGLREDDSCDEFAPRALNLVAWYNISIFHDRLRPGLRENTTARSTTLRISAIGLKSDGVVHITIEQIAIKNGHAWTFFAFDGTLKYSRIGLYTVQGEDESC